MPLRISLKPFERLIINGASIRNGSKAADFLIESHCKFIRESEIIRDSEADTPAKVICVTLQVIHLANDPTEAQGLLFAQAVELLKAMPSAATFLLKIQDALAAGQTYVALKAGKQLMYHERDLMAARKEDTRAA
ncbi:flagellar biosynthesis repressor FlbT [Methylobacterium sp. E-016]|uniref:flagellar biosynthesis repressor FlbT n=1 Tax=Methylobacterium sp. E-016 TaxID=2836556 RepID=UPI001FB86FBA|nr:flagellar biosynthesis repressor FlbT [Methylobacterium sp. E-016]MCJ2075436.1 flagellar biosynthesis repressor FlbT [Methylobacterium sp. E-016]